MDRKWISIYEIAREAGVSPATVSRVMNQSARVSAEKRERVLQVIDKYGFKPNALAKGLNNSRRGVLGILSAWVDSPFYGRMISECERVANARDYTLMMFCFSSDPQQERRHLEKMYEQCVDAAIILGGSMDGIVVEENALSIINYIAETIPVVVMGRSQGVPCYEVRIDEGGAMETAMEYLIGLGHREIAFLGGLENVYSSLEKRLAYQRSLRKHGLEFRKEWMRFGDYTSEEGFRIMSEVLKERRPSAAIGINDLFAAGMLRAVRDAGLKVPDDISIIGFDNTNISRIVSPALTSVACDYHELAEKLIGAAADAVEGKEVAGNQTVKTMLHERESCRRMG